MTQDSHLRASFDREAQRYHEIRPHYPEALFDDIVQVAGLKPGDHLLEIGPGTGQATASLAKRSFQITAVELGANLAEVARNALRGYENVRIVVGAFEDVELPDGSFDLVYAATAFHWIQQEAKFNKPYRLLRPGGHLVIIHSNHVSDEIGDAFFFASQPIYRKYGFDDPEEDFHLPHTIDLKAAELDEDLFSLVFFKAFPLAVHYSADDYAKLIGTYSPTIAMQTDQRDGFLRDIAELIEAKFNGVIEKHYAMTLTIARKKS